MDELKILFVGVGSIAKRHIKNLCVILEEQGTRFQIDVFRSNRQQLLDSIMAEYVCDVYYELEDVPNDYTIIFITNPTEYHLQTLKFFHDKGQHFFIEKPICSLQQIDKIQLEYLRDNSVYYVACPLRYTAVLQYVKENIDLKQVYSVRSISSSYLPEWRPGIDYRTTYSAHKELGGGVAIDLIHEWDYLNFLFGKPDKVYNILKRVSDLEIDTEDIAIYISEYCDKVVELHLDYIGRYPVRKLELFMKEDTVVCDLIKSAVTFQKSGKVIEFSQERDSFQKAEMRHFLDLIEKEKVGTDKIYEALDILKLAGGN